MTLEELIIRLESEDLTRSPVTGISFPHSYRGQYQDLAFVIIPGNKVTIGDMLSLAKSVVGRSFADHKGGDQPKITENTNIWVVTQPFELGKELDDSFVDFMLGNVKEVL